jgi:hypothetical protein
MAQTAVEWLIHQLNTRQKPLDNSQIDELFDKAKEMEKDQSEKIRTDAILNYKCKYCGGEDKGQ